MQLTREVYFLCGNHVVPRRTMYNWASGFLSAIPRIPGEVSDRTTEVEGQHGADNVASSCLVEDGERRHLPFLFACFGSRRCTFAHDKVYALADLALWPEGSQHLTIDYTLSIETLFLQLLRTLSHITSDATQDLDFLATFALHAICNLRVRPAELFWTFQIQDEMVSLKVELFHHDDGANGHFGSTLKYKDGHLTRAGGGCVCRGDRDCIVVPTTPFGTVVEPRFRFAACPQAPHHGDRNLKMVPLDLEISLVKERTDEFEMEDLERLEDRLFLLWLKTFHEQARF